MTYAYIRVSTDKQDCENQKFEIINYCNRNNISIDQWIEETISGTKNPEKRKLGKILTNVHEGDLIICTEISRLGRSLYIVMDILHRCMDKGVVVQTIKDNFCLRDDISSKVLSFAFALAAEIRARSNTASCFFNHPIPNAQKYKIPQEHHGLTLKFLRGSY